MTDDDTKITIGRAQRGVLPATKAGPYENNLLQVRAADLQRCTAKARTIE